MHKYTLNTSESKKIDKAIAYFIAVDMMPYSIVEKDGFKHFLQIIQPSYRPPSRKSLTDTMIPNMFLETRENIKLELQETDFVSFTADAWTSIANKSYVSLTAHYICNWKLKSACLNCKQVEEDHTGENLAEIYRHILADWDIPATKVVQFTTDSGRNIVKAIQLLGIRRIPCFGHTMNNAVQKGLELEDISTVLTKIKQIQNLSAHNWKFARDLKNVQHTINFPQRNIPSYSKTRWWSILKLIRAMVEQNVPLMTLLKDYV